MSNLITFCFFNYFLRSGGVYFGEYTPATTIVIKDSNDNTWNSSSGTNITDNWKITINGSLLDVDCNENETVGFTFYCDGSDLYIPHHMYDGEVIFTPTVLSVSYGIDYQLTINFPDVKVTEFLQWVAAITGTYPRQVDNVNGKLEFVPYKQIFDNVANAVDWSNKLVRAYDDDAPRELGFTVDGWAQVNNYNYKKDEQKGTFADYQITIPNVQLDEEQDVVGDIFQTTKPANNVPIYKVNESDNQQTLLAYLFPDNDQTGTPLEADSQDPCVLVAQPLEVNGTNYIMGAFADSLYWKNILNTSRYWDFIRSLRKAKVLHEVFALSDYDIKTFDETIPVYLAQYGHYYAVTEIKTSDTGVCDVTLFQLELI